MGFRTISLILVLAIQLINAQVTLASDKFKRTKQADCKTVRLDNSPGPMSKIPIQDQNGNALCAAYAATQLIDTWRLQNERPFLDFTSPFSLGIKYSALTNRTNLFGLPPKDVLDKAKNIEPCTYSSVGDFFQSNMTTVDVIEQINKAHAAAQKSPAALAGLAAEIKNCFSATPPIKRNTLDIAAITRHLQETTFVQAAQKILQDVCDKRTLSLKTIPNAKEILAIRYGNLERAMNIFSGTIAGRLDAQPGKPTGITYCRDVLFDVNKSSLLPTGGFTVGPGANGDLRRQFPVTQNGCDSDAHNAVIVGRRLVRFKKADGTYGSTCQYLVRDSYGTSCQPFPPDPATFPSERCERGQVWVDEDALLYNVSRVFHLED